MTKCDRCRYWVWDGRPRETSKPSGFTGIGECRRSAPSCFNEWSKQGYWPVTANLQGCGQGRFRWFKVKCIKAVERVTKVISPKYPVPVDQARLEKAIHDLRFSINVKGE